MGDIIPLPVKCKVLPGRPKNEDVRSREYLTKDEVERLLKAAKKAPRNGHRNYTALLLAYRHGLRASELAQVRWSQIDLKAGTFLVKRLKGGKTKEHYLRGDEIRELRKVQRDYKDNGGYVFVSERKSPLSKRSIQNIVSTAGQKAGFSEPLHAHMLRHACGYHLAFKGVDTRRIQDHLGHVSIEHTVRYTELVSDPGIVDVWDE